jgi:hypothetical protein
VPNAAPHQGILSVSFREIPWLLKKISQPLKFAVVTRSNFSRTDTQIWLASGSNVPILLKSSKFFWRGNLLSISRILKFGIRGETRN